MAKIIYNIINANEIFEIEYTILLFVEISRSEKDILLGKSKLCISILEVGKWRKKL